MAHYRICFLDSSGAIARGISLDLPDDNAAFASALARSTEHAVEVWDGHRKVCFIDQNGERRTGTG